MEPGVSTFPRRASRTVRRRLIRARRSRYCPSMMGDPCPVFCTCLPVVARGPPGFVPASPRVGEVFASCPLWPPSLPGATGALPGEAPALPDGPPAASASGRGLSKVKLQALMKLFKFFTSVELLAPHAKLLFSQEAWSLRGTGAQISPGIEIGHVKVLFPL